MNYENWLKEIPGEITADPLWKVEAYRLAVFASDIGWHDVSKLMRDKRTLDLSNQLYRALGSISANVSEGYSRGTGKDRARFYEYALGSARESRGWYWNGRHVLSTDVTHHRLGLLTQIIRLLLTIVPDQRGFLIHEDTRSYKATPPQLFVDPSWTDPVLLPELLERVPEPS